MPFDATLPADHTPVVATELRNQFNALKALVDDLQDQINGVNTQLQLRPDNGAVEADTSGATLSVAHLNLTVSNPPTQTEMQAVADKLDEMLVGLHRE